MTLQKNCQKEKFQKVTHGDEGSVFNELEYSLIREILENYDEGEVIISNPKTEALKRYERSKALVSRIEALGTVPTKEAARKLGVSVSTIRRARKNIEAYENLMEKDGECKE